MEVMVHLQTRRAWNVNVKCRTKHCPVQLELMVVQVLVELAMWSWVPKHCHACFVIVTRQKLVLVETMHLVEVLVVLVHLSATCLVVSETTHLLWSAT